jgi:hypothetical protein
MTAGADPTPFSARVVGRKRRWWNERASLRTRAHRLVELNAMRSAHEPLDAWRCCEYWQRTLSNKLNGRAFARHLGCQVPEVYWTGRRVSRIPWHRIPSEFVLKPLWGGGSHGAYAMSGGHERITGVAMTREALRAQLDAARRPIRWIPLVVEEHVRRPDGSYGFALEFRFHVFRDTIAAITCANEHHQVAFYTASWEPFEQALIGDRAVHHMPRPDCLEEMCAAALRIGDAYGDYVRVDLFSTDKGVVFNELAATPLNGRGYTEFADRYLGGHWERMLQRYGESARGAGGG